MKKALILLVFALLAASAAVAIAFRRAPAFVEQALERQLGKEVTLKGVQYHFPLGLEIREFAIIEKGEFAGETSFYVENVSFSLDAPALLARRVEIPHLIIKNPQITIRKQKEKLVHAFSAPAAVASREEKPQPVAASSQTESKSVPFHIDRLTVENGALKWIDYDISREGFAVVCRIPEAKIENLSLDRRSERTRYAFKAEMVQARDRAPAQIAVSGWTNFVTYDSDAKASVRQLWLPFFKPYYERVSSSVIGDGTLDLQSTTRIQSKRWVTNGRLDLHNLQFASFEPEGKLFGFEAGPLIDILRSKSGRITLDVVIERNLADPAETRRQAIRRSIEKSLKATFLNNIQTVVENTLDRLAEDPDSLKKDWKSLVDSFKSSTE